nr:class I SAM-dependent methyltransferase [Pseudenhygromyxa sp. WMMC2535]
MGWYDTFSRFYDRSLEPLYRSQRLAAAEALALAPGLRVLDLPCGTGLSFPSLAPALGSEGALVGVDLSAGMLAKAQARADAAGWSWVRTLHRDVHALDSAQLATDLGEPAPCQVDRLHLFLGLTAFPEWEAAFAKLWALLAPGGRCVIVDVHAAKPNFRGRMVNLVARADIRRRVWEPLEAAASSYERRELPSEAAHGGQLFLAVGDKPR